MFIISFILYFSFILHYSTTKFNNISETFIYGGINNIINDMKKRVKSLVNIS